MSESSPEGTGTGTGQSQGGSAGQPSGTGQGSSKGASPSAGTAGDGEDPEAAGLLGGMLENDPAKLAEEVSKWKSLARKHEATAKQNTAAARRLQEIEDANKTELQKAQDAANAAEERARKAEENHNRVIAAATHDLPVELIDVLGSGTEDEIMARAESIATAVNERAQALAKQIVESMGMQFPANGNGSATAAGAARMAGMAGTRPVESMRPGATPASGGSPRSREDWFRAMVAGDTQ